DHIKDLAAPLPGAQSFTAALADVILEAAAALVRHMPDFGGLDHAIDDQGRAQPGAQAEEQHAAAPIAADRLHGCIVDHLDRPAESLLEIQTDPAHAKVGALRRASPQSK